MSYAERRKGKLTGWWYGEVEVKKPDGLEVRFRRRFKSKTEADGYEAYVRATGEEPAGTVGAPSETFEAVARLFLSTHPDWGRRDHSSHQRLEWAIGFLGKLPIKSVTTMQLDRMVTKLRGLKGPQGAPLSNRTINRYLAAVSKVLRFAHKRGLIAMPHIPTLENRGNDRTETVSFDLEDAICRWIEANADPRVAFMVRLFAETGMRKMEPWRVRPEQIENEGVTLTAEQTKTNAARWVSIPPEMATQYRAMVAAKTLPKPFRVYRVFKQAVKACGGHEELTLHSLRHTRATRLIEAGVDPLKAAALLGHRSLQTTKRYTHLSKAALAEAAKKVHQARGETDEKGEIVQLDAFKKAL